MNDLKKLPEHIQKIFKDVEVNLDLESTDNYEGDIKRKIKLPPSIIERRILVDVPKDYKSYLYLTIDTLNPLYPIYLGIKKDKLQEHGADPYWSSSKNDEFIKLRQSSKPRFINLIIGFADYFVDHKQQEYKILSENFPDIKNNNLTYNNSYGMPPVGRDGLPTKEYYKWFGKQLDDKVWKTSVKESPKELLAKAFHIQPREKEKGDVESNSHRKDITKNVKAMDKNTDKLDDVLLFENVAHMFPDLKLDSSTKDAIAGSWHGLNGANDAGALEIGTVRVPDWVFKGKSPFFVKSLAHFHNRKRRLNLESKAPEVKKYLKDMYDATGIKPDSKVAKEMVKMTYENMSDYYIKEGIKRALQAIEEDEKPDTKHKYWEREELEKKKKKEEETYPDTICEYMSTGKINEWKILSTLQNDMHVWDTRPILDKNKKKIGTEKYISGYGKGLNRKKITALVHVGQPEEKAQWLREKSMKHTTLMFWLQQHDFELTFKTLEDRVSDVTANEKKKD